MIQGRIEDASGTKSAAPERQDPLDILVLGTRGPGVEGGIERHVDELVPLLASHGMRCEVIGRSPYRTDNEIHPDVKVTWLWAPKVSWLETLLHSFLGLLYAAIRRPDVVHVHAVGPALITPFARLLGLNVVVTHHGFDYEREKWGGFARSVIRLGESLGMRFANQRIVISTEIRQRVEENYERDTRLIPNGVRLPELAQQQAVLDELGLTPQRYVLQVSRLVPEKRQMDLIKAFREADLDGWKLVFAGTLVEGNDYVERLVREGEQCDDVVFAGFRSGEALNELYTHAGIFVLPSSHEGLPIALLESLSYGLTAVASAIPSNLEVGLPEQQYFPLGNTSALAAKLQRFSRTGREACDVLKRREFVRDRYDWKKIALDTLQVYRAIKR